MQWGALKHWHTITTVRIFLTQLTLTPLEQNKPYAAGSEGKQKSTFFAAGQCDGEPITTASSNTKLIQLSTEDYGHDPLNGLMLICCNDSQLPMIWGTNE